MKTFLISSLFLLIIFLTAITTIIGGSCYGQPVDCLASVGTVFPPDINVICPNGISAPITIVGDNQVGFQTIWLISTQNNDSIVGLSYTNSINAANLDFPVGEVLGGDKYHIRPLNYDILQTAQLLDILTNGTSNHVTDFITQINNNSICAIIGNPFEMLVPAPIYVGYEVICDEQNQGFFSVQFVVTGGLPALSNNYYYTYQGDLSSNSIDNGVTFAIGPFTDGQGFTLTATDNCQSQTIEQVNVACTKCDYTAGTMSQELVTFYNNESIVVAGSIDASTEGVDMYVLHTISDTLIGTILAIDTLTTDGTGDFGVNIPGLLPETTYYVSLWVGNDNAPEDGQPDNDGCSKVCRGTPIRVLTESAIEATEIITTDFKPKATYNTETSEISADFWTTENGLVHVLLHNLNGQCLADITYFAQKGHNIFAQNLGNNILETGLYLLSFQNKQQVQTMKFVVTH